MATEPFLINPPRRLKRRRRNPVGETLVTIGANPMRRRRKNPDNPWYGDPGGHRIAALMRWGSIPRGRIRKYRKRGRPKVSFAGARTKRKYVRHRRRASKPEFASVFGMYRPGGKAYGRNPVRRRRISMRRRRKNPDNPWYGDPGGHRKAARLGWRRGHKGVRRRRGYRRNPVTANPRHRYGRRYRRRNPAMRLDFAKFTGGIMDVQSWAPLAVTGATSAITGAVVPQMIGVVNPWAKLGTQLAVAVGGGMVVENFVDKRHGQAWMIVGVAMVGYQLLKQFVLIPFAPQFAVGLGEYNDYVLRDVSQEVGAFPQEISAFPGEMSAYPGVGQEAEVGAYPYDGTGY